MAPEEVAVAFFSYCREDSEFALKLAEDLKVAGAHVWIDQLDIEPGTPWDRAVEAALNNSPRMLVVLSPVSVNSDNVRDEVSFALSRQKRVIPVLYRDCEVPFRLARLQHIDFRPDYERALKILVRALGVGQAQAAAVASAVSAAEAAASAAEAEEQARLQQERERKAEEEKERQQKTHAERRLAAAQARLKEEREAAAERAAREQEQQRPEAEAPARHEQLRREQRAAEQARLEEEARLAAERARLAQQERERREAEIKARQEQLRREEEESVERKSLSLDAEPKLAQAATEPPPPSAKTEPSDVSTPSHIAEEPKRPATLAHIESSPVVAHGGRVPPARQQEATGLNFTSPKYLAGGAILLAVLGGIIFLLAGRGGPEKAATDKVSDAKAGESGAVQQPQPQATAEKVPADSPPAQAAAPSGTPSQDQNKEKSGPAPANTKEIAKSKNPPPQNMADTSFLNSAGAGAPGTSPNPANAANTSKPATSAAAPNPVRISQGTSQGLLIHQVKPVYPPLARSARVQGQVVLHVVIAKNGGVKTIAAETGHPMLIPAAIDAVKQWRYKPYKLDGKPVEVDTQVLVNFTLTN